MRKWLCAALIAAGAAGAGLAAAVGCGSSDCTFDRTCGSAYVQSLNDGGITYPAGCDAGDDPTQNGKCVDKTVGVFVSSQGNDQSGDGTKEKPFQSFQAAVSKLGSGKPWLFVCAGQYKTNLLLSGVNGIDGADAGDAGHVPNAVKMGIAQVGIYGGFSCGSWQHDGPKATIVPSDPDLPALHLNALSTGDVKNQVTDLDIQMSDAQGAGASSVAVLVTNSVGVVIQRCNLAAGKGQVGADGVSPPPWSGPADNGDAGSGNNGGAPGKSTCGTSDVVTSGGAGGGNGFGGDAGTPPLGGGKGGNNGSSCNGGGFGGDGIGGAAGTDGDGASVPGTLSVDGWKGQDGTPGKVGNPGQGGGGGGGGPSGPSGGGGGGGGSGGCGGPGGQGGQAGGSSIALASFKSTIQISNSVLTASDAAGGGRGATGQPGQAFGRGANPSNLGGCQGGNGGPGGNGGAGGGGAGGISVALLYDTQLPTFDPSTRLMFSSNVAAGGKGGTAGHDGQVGISKPTYSPK